MFLRKLIEENQIFHHYQSIYDIHKWNVVGYEALLRTTDKENPEKVFNMAIKENELYNLDTYSIKKAISSFNLSLEFVESNYLFSNVYPSTLVNPNFLPFIKELDFCKLNLVLEINESELVYDLKKLKSIINHLKKLNVSIAIDDVGKGNSDIIKILELKPDYIKIDSYVTQNVHKSPEKQSLIKLLSNYCDEFEIKLILEGIDDIDVLFLLRENGANFGQGFLLGKPTNLSIVNLQSK
ncbi:EAL domain-containing protein [Filobacillus milosensis]|uniref:EAL domain-containing protein n=1 Tax=Filobacillus milosensis TaxID=94137 RepID=A0A4Y8IXH1_9BACI|nr:EAL domain-containing protein [Filobacillus milosensis]TFB25115.1 EAL domain-containing protein [Filobacillus milosensis]